MIIDKDRFTNIVSSIYSTLLVESRLGGKAVTAEELATALREHDAVLAEKFLAHDSALSELRTYIESRSRAASN